MENYLKYLSRLPKKLRLRLFQTLEAIHGNAWAGLDIKPLQGMKGFYRCRLGDIRIIFEKRDQEVIVHMIGPRGGVYKNL